MLRTPSNFFGGPALFNNAGDTTTTFPFWKGMNPVSGDGMPARARLLKRRYMSGKCRGAKTVTLLRQAATAIHLVVGTLPRLAPKARSLLRSSQQGMRELAPNRRSNLRHVFGRTKPVEPRHQRSMQACGTANTGDETINRLRGRAFASGFQHRLRHLLDEQRNAIGVFDNVLPDARRQQLIACDLFDQCSDRGCGARSIVG